MDAFSRLQIISKKKQSNISFVSYDSGGSNILAYMALRLDNSINKKILTDGPGKKIWKNIFPSTEFNETPSSIIEFSDIIITGTGHSDYEHLVRLQANNNNIYTIAILDHWVNYLERFSFGDKKVLPQEIWVMDNEAFKLANKLFSNIKITKINNDYYDFAKFQISNNSLNSNNVLYVMEILDEVWKSNTPGWLDAFKYFWEEKENLINGKIDKIFIRPHPKDEINKYDILKSKYNNLFIDYNTSIIDSLMNSSLVVGVESAALDLAGYCGIKTFSSMPPWGRKIRIPNENIDLISDFVS